MSRGKALRCAVRKLNALQEKDRTDGTGIKEMQKMDRLADTIDRLSMPKGWQEKSDAEHARRMAILDDVLARLKEF